MRPAVLFYANHWDLRRFFSDPSVLGPVDQRDFMKAMTCLGFSLTQNAGSRSTLTSPGNSPSNSRIVDCIMASPSSKAGPYARSASPSQPERRGGRNLLRTYFPESIVLPTYLCAYNNGFSRIILSRFTYQY
ncbi:hypothetical protein BDZ97DRAFT_1407218 [Flammula alnicola]|nr:hypothetical protein BDZ97DRAFT_1407218 [Flammula alnicola]